MAAVMASILSPKQYCCNGCLANGCCSTYEYCMSWASSPTRTLPEALLNRGVVAFQNLFMTVEDHFQLCLARCRNSSQSVQHENT
ncbi:UPF0454 protein C12orf49-like protein [Sciurus carolinensis]|uniref:SREBP regulating gene protein n=1 Tax=Sciurus carolinensis TaxID=30640 RepID=A0AA41NAZ8_SCICA|nr:UPF0454 protein C12orf49-like protein [Sciurus carolinensis]